MTKSHFTIWINKINLGPKRLILIIGYTALTAYISLTVFMILIIILLIAIIYFVIFYGIFIRKKVFKSINKYYEIRDYILPINSNKNYREIKPIGSNAITSKIFIKNTKKWAFFDIIRQAIITSKLKPFRQALILGGGGASVPYCLAKDYPKCKIDVVEISMTMINIAKTYFVKQFSNQIKFHHLNANKFIHHLKTKYDLIFIDIYPDLLTQNQKFIHQIKKASKSSSLIIINLTNSNKKNLTPWIKYCQSIFGLNNFNLYLCGKNIIAIVCKQNLLNFPSALKII